MIPAKEAKDMLYKMLSENFMSLQVATALEVPNSKLAATGEHPGKLLWVLRDTAATSETEKKDWHRQQTMRIIESLTGLVRETDNTPRNQLTAITFLPFPAPSP